MKKFIMVLLNLCILSTIDSANSQALRRMWTAEESEIWNLEYNYWKYVELGDNQGKKALWHSKGINWFDEGYDKYENPQIVKTGSEELKSSTSPVNFIPLAIRISGDLAFTMLRVILLEKQLSSDTKSEDYLKVMHVWIKQNNKWLLLNSFSDHGRTSKISR